MKLRELRERLLNGPLTVTRPQLQATPKHINSDIAHAVASITASPSKAHAGEALRLHWKEVDLLP
ncbi:hypothetical protein [Burkholderia perseverans]|uniref:hypothetical protein n=1 Tax=Burkholderia perseverans TaxID=2615214 RepID=UPI001FEFDC5D|nr:hypothetical protein [Burkholderia perseverans]